MSDLVFVDVEATGATPARGTMTEFGAVHEPSLVTFHGVLFESTPDPVVPAIPVVGLPVASEVEVAQRFAVWLVEVCGTQRPIFVSDNPAFDWQWVAAMFDRAGMENPFGHSARRLGDYWAGLRRNWRDATSWKKLRVTPHTHHPVDDAMGNVEAYREMRQIESAMFADVLVTSR